MPASPESTPQAAKRALVIRIGALGDVLLTRRLTYSLSRAGLRSTLFAPARHASLLQADPWIDGVLDSESPSFASAFTGEWRNEVCGFDLGLVISKSDGLARAAESAARRVARIQPEPWRDDVSIALQWAEAAIGSGAVFQGTLPSLFASPDESMAQGATLIHPGSGSPAKNWPLERFVDLSRELRQGGHRVVWILGPAEGGIPSPGSEFEVLDRPSLGALAATLSQARVFVGNDSGVSHLAAAVGAPTVAIFGPTSDVVFRPDGPRVATARSASGALESLGVDRVLSVIEELTKCRLRPLAGP